jgi:hypothetical protein
MMQKSTTFTTILRVKKCHFHYDMQKSHLEDDVHYFFIKWSYCPPKLSQKVKMNRSFLYFTFSAISLC